jgi:hypothetical protein
MKCLLCFIVGHKWFSRNFEQYIDENGRKNEDVTIILLTHCMRCGEKSPEIQCLK